ncbi:hypothetical protein L5515_011939 [Caenorhabditis briggsae]|uniref:Uncharacterized protein n=1 Tax=Caenorhabditis briggsae TaxID=6238 RepID=A0AAE9EXY0_CAEBR|nr:hypothetical protein L5515_011939 [Caenorhabditis briggsae]
MSDRKNELVAVVIDIDGDKRKMVEDIADIVLRRVLEEEEENESSTPMDLSRTSNSTSTDSSPLSVNQLLSSSFSSQLTTTQPHWNPLQLALCQSLIANNAAQLPLFGAQSPLFSLFTPPVQPAVEPVELMKIFQSILEKQRK